MSDTDSNDQPRQQGRRPDASMTLITTMLERPLDPGYQEAADRRSARGLPAATSTRTVIAVAMAILTGFLFAVAAQALRPKPTAAASVKSELVSRIESLQQHGSAQEAKLTAVAKQVRDYEDLTLNQSGRTQLAQTISSLELEAGTVSLTGPGLTLTLDDAASVDTDADAGTRPSGGFEPGRVSSSDLQIVVNGLWAAGAEAISINGHRLTSTAAIRFAGQAVIVDFRPLARPYVVTVLGDADTIRARFDPSFAGQYLVQLTKEYGIVSGVQTSDTLTVPGDSAARLVVAEPLPPSRGSGPTSPPNPLGAPPDTRSS